MAAELTKSDVEAAATRITDSIERTPALHSRTLSELLSLPGAEPTEVYLKFENLQFTGSFKDRGSLNRLLAVDRETTNGVIAMSAGNHAQGVAYHGRRLGLPTTIVMPEGTPFVKVARTRQLGAEVVVAGSSVEGAAERALELAAEQNLDFIHPYDDPLVIAGQGTVGLELQADLPELDIVIAPVGGGGLAAGVALAYEGTDVEVLGVQSDRFPSMQAKLAGLPAPTFVGATIADGIAVKAAGELTSEVLRSHGIEVLTVSEAAIEQAIAMLLEIEKTVVEGAGAAPLAVVLQHGERFAGRRVGLILSGGNIDPRTLSVVTLRGLGRQDRLVRLRVEIDDRPGLLAKVTTAIAELGANVVEVEHERMGSSGARSSVVIFMLDTLDAAHVDRVAAELDAITLGATKLAW